MFNLKFGEIFPYLYNQFEPSEIILVDSNINYWQKVLKDTNMNVHFVSNSINKFDSQINWSFYTTLLWNEEKKVFYYEFNNPLLNGTISTDILKNIWKNIETKSTKIISAEDINNFICSNISNDSNKFLILENLDSYNIIKNLDINTHNIKVLAIRTINDIAVNSSKIDLDKFIEKNNFKKVMYYEDHHPKLGLIVYIKDDIKSLTLSLEEKNNELQNISNTLEEEKKNLSSKNSDNQKLKDDIKSLTLSLEEKNNELVKLNYFKSIENDINLFIKEKNYYIKNGYISRTEYTHYNDQVCEDEWQLEIYLHALGLMKKYNLKSVIDIGCGSGYKLMHYLHEYETIGLELKENLDFLTNKYPQKKWQESNFNIDYKFKADVLICSDVIEHLVNPNQLLEFIKKISFKYLVLSTPERDLVYKEGSKLRDGPPRNQAHVREWNFNEFYEYISKHFEIIDHRVTNLGQSTQMIICTNYKK